MLLRFPRASRLLQVFVLLLLVFSPSQLLLEREPMFTPEGADVARSAAALNDQGVRLYYEGRLEQALGSFILSSELDPYFAVAHYNCAVVLTTRGFQGDLETAVQHLQWAYRIDPGDEMIQEFLLELQSLAHLAV